MVNLNLKPTSSTTNIKFLCSYGGKILPRHSDGKLRYHGGHTRVLAVDRSISFSELRVKLREMCGASSVTLRCQLPTEDLDALVSITSDEDLANLIEEYDRAASPPSSLKIRAFLSPPKSIKKISPPPSMTAASSSKSSSSSSLSSGCSVSKFSIPVADNCYRQISTPPPAMFPLCVEKSGVTGKVMPHHYPYYAHGYPSHIYLVHNGNHWQ